MARARSSRTALVITALLTAVALAAAVVGVWMFIDKRAEANDIRSERSTVRVQQQEAVDFATKVMTNLMTIRQDTLQQDVDRLVADIGGDFAGQFNPRRDSYQAVVELNKIVAEGSVVAAGLETQTTDETGHTQYIVVMAVDQSIQNNATPIGPDGSAAPTTAATPTAAPTSAATTTPKDDVTSTTTGNDAPSGGATPNSPPDPGQAEPGKPENHTYRVRVTVSKQDDGTLKVTGVDFIP